MTSETTQYTVARCDIIYLLNVVLFIFIDVSLLLALCYWHKNTHDTLESRLRLVSTPKSHKSKCVSIKDRQCGV